MPKKVVMRLSLVFLFNSYNLLRSRLTHIIFYSLFFIASVFKIQVSQAVTTTVNLSGSAVAFNGVARTNLGILSDAIAVAMGTGHVLVAKVADVVCPNNPTSVEFVLYSFSNGVLTQQSTVSGPGNIVNPCNTNSIRGIFPISDSHAVVPVMLADYSIVGITIKRTNNTISIVENKSFIQSSYLYGAPIDSSRYLLAYRDGASSNSPLAIQVLSLSGDTTSLGAKLTQTTAPFNGDDQTGLAILNGATASTFRIIRGGYVTSYPDPLYSFTVTVSGTTVIFNNDTVTHSTSDGRTMSPRVVGTADQGIVIYGSYNTHSSWGKLVNGVYTHGGTYSTSVITDYFGENTSPMGSANFKIGNRYFMRSVGGNDIIYIDGLDGAMTNMNLNLGAGDYRDTFAIGNYILGLEGIRGQTNYLFRVLGVQ